MGNDINGTIITINLRKKMIILPGEKSYSGDTGMTEEEFMDDVMLLDNMFMAEQNITSMLDGYEDGSVSNEAIMYLTGMSAADLKEHQVVSIEGFLKNFIKKKFGKGGNHYTLKYNKLVAMLESHIEKCIRPKNLTMAEINATSEFMENNRVYGEAVSSANGVDLTPDYDSIVKVEKSLTRLFEFFAGGVNMKQIPRYRDAIDLINIYRERMKHIKSISSKDYENRKVAQKWIDKHMIVIKLGKRAFLSIDKFLVSKPDASDSKEVNVIAGHMYYLATIYVRLFKNDLSIIKESILQAHKRMKEENGS